LAIVCGTSTSFINKKKTPNDIQLLHVSMYGSHSTLIQVYVSGDKAQDFIDPKYSMLGAVHQYYLHSKAFKFMK